MGDPPRFVVFGYLPEYRLKNFPYAEIFASGLTHLIFFSAEVHPQTLHLDHAEDRLPDAAEWRQIRRLADEQGVQLLLCIGGGGRSSGFAPLVRDQRRRLAFLDELNALVLRRQLDGIDINWEYPQSMEEWSLFGDFLREMRSILGYSVVTRAASTGRQPRRQPVQVRPVILTMAVHPHPSIAAVLQMSRILPTLNYLHWMAYDHTEAGGGSPHSSVAYAATTLSDAMIGLLDDATFYGTAQHRSGDGDGSEVDHRRKLTLGIPFYGRHLRSASSAPETYSRLMQFILPWSRKHHPEWATDGSPLRALNEYGGFGFNSYADVQAKMQLARDGPVAPEAEKRPGGGGVAGIMIWELGQDLQPPSAHPMALMNAVHHQLTEWAKEAERNAIHRSTPGPPTTKEKTEKNRSNLASRDGTGATKGSALHDQMPSVNDANHAGQMSDKDREDL